MRFKLASSLLLLLGIWLSPTFLNSTSKTEAARPQPENGEETSVRAVIQSYGEVFKSSNAEKAKSSFYEGVRIFTYASEGVMEVGGKQYYRALTRNKKQYPPVPYNEKILHIDINGNAAIAKVEFNLPGARLGGTKTNPYDPPPGVTNAQYVSLLKLKDGWRIVSIVASLREGK